MSQNLFLYMGIIEVFIIFFFNILIWVFNKNKLFNKIISLFSTAFIFFTIINILINYLEFKYIFLIKILSIIFFISISILIILSFSKKLINLENAFKELNKKNFDYNHNLKLKGDFKNFTKTYIEINENFRILSTDVSNLIDKFNKTLISLNEKISMVDSNIKEQKSITENFNMAIDVLCKSAEIGATGLDKTRRMFNENAENFNILFDKIKILFSQNLNMQKENQNMEKFSLSAIRFSIDLNDVTKSGTKKIDAIVGSIESFSNSVKKIIEMINLIKKISAQTNLLAINASIEAAHAGDAGQGFAVVADEIRQLSESSSKVTAKITDIVEGVTKDLSADQLKSKSAKEGIEDIKEAFSKNINFINLLADSINQQIESVDEMKENIEGVHDLSKDIKSSALSQQKTTQEIYEATETLNAQAFLIGQLIMRQKVNLNTISDSLDSLNNIIKTMNKISDLLPELKRKILPENN